MADLALFSVASSMSPTYFWIFCDNLVVWSFCNYVDEFLLGRTDFLVWLQHTPFVCINYLLFSSQTVRIFFSSDNST